MVTMETVGQALRRELGRREIGPKTMIGVVHSMPGNMMEDNLHTNTGTGQTLGGGILVCLPGIPMTIPLKHHGITTTTLMAVLAPDQAPDPPLDHHLVTRVLMNTTATTSIAILTTMTIMHRRLGGIGTTKLWLGPVTTQDNTLLTNSNIHHTRTRFRDLCRTISRPRSNKLNNSTHPSLLQQHSTVRLFL